MSAHTTFTNALIHEQSPYLLQHAHNPVNWIAWSSSIFELAQTQNKPILLSIGYAACHWCHVMERESFEDEEVARYMNAHFINVKVDREERPDVDQIYMDALQAMTGSGGWPLNIFLLPNGKPFYGGTYFPPKTLPQRASWMDVLKGVHEAFQTNQEKLIEQANNLTTHLVQTNIKEKIDFDSTTTYPSLEEFDLMTKRILQNADTQWGGFGVAPKFPQTFSIQVLLRNYFANKDQSAIVHAVRSLDKMIQGGLYDHLGGGFARYSTDAQWQAPHFEKMLYDNALLIGVLTEAYQLTKKRVYKNVIQETIHFVFRELSDTNGMFYAALDADSEGVEGKYYTWSYEELQALLPENLLKPFCQYFQIKEAGNWEHTNIVWTINLIEEAWNEDLVEAKKILFTQREKRIRPGTDTKILLSWNCLMIIALCKAYAITEDKSLLERAEKNMQWLSIHMQSKEGYLFHSSTNGHLKSMAFLEDYASMMQALIELHKATGNKSYLKNAKSWMEYVQLHFIDEQKVFFYFTSDEQ
ncbi:MAG: thioredoxin domain-containing protein, partial [Sediminibacterium sp.]